MSGGESFSRDAGVVDSHLQAGLRAAYAQALEALRIGRAAAAERQFRAIQEAAPGDVNSLRWLGVALLAQDKVQPAIDVLEQVVGAAPDFPQARVDLARAYRQDGRLENAREALKRVLHEMPELQEAWVAFAAVLVDLQKYEDARFAFERARLLDPQLERIDAATAALLAADRRRAEEVFREVLKADASHVAALCGLAAVALSAGNHKDSERLLRHALRQSPHSPLAQRGLSNTLLSAGRLEEAETTMRKLLRLEPENPQNWIALGAVYTRLLRQSEALEAFEEAVRLKPQEVRLRLSIGHLNKTLGRREACERAYHECLRMNPDFGEAYWSLADLKNYTFNDDEVAAMSRLLERPAHDADNTAQVHFALGRALEQRQQYSQSFAHYARGNALRRRTSPFSITKFEEKSQRVMRLYDQAFFAPRAGGGNPDAAPIFVVGLPRSGSTLVEQILASHSSVEGTMELPNILTLVREFDHADARGDAYPESVRPVAREGLTALGTRYLLETQPLRTGKPRFIDKMPNNFSHVGFIHAILPNATIVDVRRHPLDACFSTFKQYFSEGQSFSYDLEDLGRYYRCYLALMDHWDAVLPGKVMHLQYEALIRDPEGNIRRLLDHCRLPFEATCLSFHQTRRAVRTASSEQVRQPLYSSGVGYWRNFSQDLDPLKAVLGEALSRFESAEDPKSY